MIPPRDESDMSAGMSGVGNAHASVVGDARASIRSAREGERAGRISEAGEHYETGLRNLSEADACDLFAELLRRIASTHSTIGRLQGELGDGEGAVRSLARARALRVEQDDLYHGLCGSWAGTATRS